MGMPIGMVEAQSKGRISCQLTTKGAGQTIIKTESMLLVFLRAR